jgi:hypothetical protein
MFLVLKSVAWCEMNNVNEWVKGALEELSLNTPVSQHVNAIAGVRISLEACFEMFNSLVDCLNLAEVTPILIVPIGDSENLSTEVPPWREVQTENLLETPSLAISLVQARLFVTRGEEYRREIETPRPFVTHSSAMVHSYYKCFRSIKSTQLGWEFTRCMYVEAVPATLVLSE